MKGQQKNEKNTVVTTTQQTTKKRYKQRRVVREEEENDIHCFLRPIETMSTMNNTNIQMLDYKII